MWLPLENNPDVMNKYLVTLGIPEPKLQFVDVFGVTPDLLAMVPAPVHAVMLVYPICKATENRTQELEDAQKDEIDSFLERQHVFFTRQLIGNACGTIAILHAVMNNLAVIGDITPDSPLFALTEAKDLTSDSMELGVKVARQENLEQAHQSAAVEGVTQNQPVEANINLHFVCFICAGGRCLELDGRKDHPLLHGACNDSASFLKAAAVAIREKMNLNPDSYEFAITALVDKR
ncbi:putative ubiquitin carboxyl-terminal hydrolase putativecysteine peptidase Clan CA family C12 [Leptomonas pyrrhocoris]|uniref:Ubiquitin carboxyl-terminal hydrolase n=1 Tax=Leptomonas pyrrhocoris TaxID=157538 RepID=A0A0M9G006_LEPPY|nr:putative ubiquitin carboxyl-terminal hydrolase putativecysteine peptidase Clan CA family C12 [Leptomonas pyrrhocoris]XP_015657849.1 putative ubiquitin carboxyl-terminal hydrolase putativecysteine peptidase Clan CA family C12 [Leptomonas pyrrhocoris]KPA79409.1 putative ubiquitin carboxyl-terminal hydrolase putativecysteine peptidase Clan CA family C12 [Leptomonas pyrrhocoris]KPA79410.1 putative ubiquitin carboxyl-terminal hydrolase putativecysteine peptidase Clan CA family C12 [Leptomonas pyrr|eukprot:XP_015657848.1 putative ubiquitin carboxyl-terminal hydrolase putativecysteine peptidase Clan CA family C12 [Leptomonas pyrrhocoris]